MWRQEVAGPKFAPVVADVILQKQKLMGKPLHYEQFNLDLLGVIRKFRPKTRLTSIERIVRMCVGHYGLKSDKEGFFWVEAIEPRKIRKQAKFVIEGEESKAEIDNRIQQFHNSRYVQIGTNKDGKPIFAEKKHARAMV